MTPTKPAKRKPAPLTPGRYVIHGCAMGCPHVVTVERRGRGFVAGGLWGNNRFAVSLLALDGWYLGRRLADRKTKRKAGW